VLVRTVSVADSGRPTGKRRVETQILHFQDDAWRPYTYIWDDDQADAALAEAGGTVRTIAVDEPGRDGRRTRDYRVQARTECTLCHNPWVERKGLVWGLQSASPLGVNTPQMNRMRHEGGRPVNQLRFLHELGLLAWTPETERLPKLADPYDESAQLDRRARSYLQTNCAHCHQFGAGGTANIALGYEMPLVETKTVDVRPLQGTFQIAGARIIAPGDPSRSVLYYRVSKLGGGRMPRVGSNEVDLRAIRMIHDWITGMPSGTGQAQADEHAAIPAEDRAALEALRQGDQTHPEARSAAIRRLTSSTRGALLLLDLVDRGPQEGPLRREVATVARQSPAIEVRDLFERLIPREERAQRLGDVVDRRAILATRGDAGRGRAVFTDNPAAQCKSCHRVSEVGQDIGPDLTRIGAKYDRAAMLDQILDPSRTIEPQYTSYLVETKDGRVLAGLLAEKTTREVVLKDAQGKTVRVPADQVERLVPQARSLMPELLLRDLTAQQVADLLEYLTMLR
jgi:putative heme-binding domain-containing protein